MLHRGKIAPGRASGARAAPEPRRARGPNFRCPTPALSVHDRIRALAADGHAETVRLRRLIHRRPELAFEEHETAALVAETLRGMGVEPVTGVAQTGVVGHVRGARPGPVRALRADIDALPIQEATGLDFASESEGRMHACGHDAHTAMLLGVARVLQRVRGDLAGTVRLIFQPSEEKAPGGAKAMIEAGVLGEMDGVGAPEAIYGQHVAPHLDAGSVGVRPGMFMASADEIYLTVRGEGGHAAAPHLLTDPVLAQAHVLTALQAVISRNRPPGVPSLLSFGRVQASGATNVVPDAVELDGTFRSMDEEWRERALELVQRTAEHAAQALGASCEVRIVRGYPALENDAARATAVRRLAADVLGEARVADLPQWYASEDFAYYTREVPGCFYVLGTGSDAADSRHGLHTPRFTVDESAMETGVAFMAALAVASGEAAASGG